MGKCICPISFTTSSSGKPRTAADQVVSHAWRRSHRKDTCPMWGEKGGPQVYLDAFLRWIEKKFWSYWWPRKGSKPVGLSLDDFIAMTWGATEGASEMSLSSPFRDNTQCSLEAELGLDIASPERKERGTLLSQNGLFLAVDQAAPPDRPTTCMLTGGGGAELVWLASRHNRVRGPQCLSHCFVSPLMRLACCASYPPGHLLVCLPFCRVGTLPDRSIRRRAQPQP